MVIGDFNQVLNLQEHSEAVNLNMDRNTAEFRDCLRTAELSDLVFKGNSFTWWNKSKTSPMV